MISYGEIRLSFVWRRGKCSNITSRGKGLFMTSRAGASKHTDNLVCATAHAEISNENVTTRTEWVINLPTVQHVTPLKSLSEQKTARWDWFPQAAPPQIADRISSRFALILHIRGRSCPAPLPAS